MKITYTYNRKREPIRAKVETDCCPTCKQPLDFTDAINGTTDCKCGEWWFNGPSPTTTSGTNDSGWHFKSKGRE